MAKGSKVISASNKPFVKGGTTKMAGKQIAGTQTPGQTAAKGTANGKFAKGGSTKMFGQQTSAPAKAR